MSSEGRARIVDALARDDRSRPRRARYPLNARFARRSEAARCCGDGFVINAAAPQSGRVQRTHSRLGRPVVRTACGCGAWRGSAPPASPCSPRFGCSFATGLPSSRDVARLSAAACRPMSAAMTAIRSRPSLANGGSNWLMTNIRRWSSTPSFRPRTALSSAMAGSTIRGWSARCSIMPPRSAARIAPRAARPSPSRSPRGCSRTAPMRCRARSARRSSPSGSSGC